MISTITCGRAARLAVLLVASALAATVALAQSAAPEAPAPADSATSSPALTPAEARPDNQQPVELEQLVTTMIEAMGSPQYHVREQATEALRKIGQPARKALEEAARGDDPEIRMRAERLLRDLRHGITPDWPSELALLARHYARLNESEQQNAIRRIAEKLEEKAAIFLASRLTGKDHEATQALSSIRSSNSAKLAAELIEAVGEPENDYQKRALVWARSKVGTPLDALRIMEGLELDNSLRNMVVEDGIKMLMGQLQDKPPKQVLETATEFAASTGDARFSYIAAEALLALGRGEEAAELQTKALALQPTSEPAHFAAANMLIEIGRNRLAAAECQQILEIEPANSVYDLNALLRLSDLYAASGLYRQAADTLQGALDGYLTARAGNSGYAMTSNPDVVKARIEQYRQRAAQYPAPDGAEIGDNVANELKLTLTEVLKDKRLADYQQALANCDVRMRVPVLPEGLRVLDLAESEIAYDVDQQALLLKLHGQVAARIEFKIAEGVENLLLAVDSVDCLYIYQLTVAGSTMKRIDRFEKDFVLAARLDGAIRGLRDVKAWLGSTEVPWPELKDGHTLDFFSTANVLRLEGTMADGRRVTIIGDYRKLEYKPAEKAELPAEEAPRPDPADGQPQEPEKADSPPPDGQQPEGQAEPEDAPPPPPPPLPPPPPANIS